MKIPSLLCLLTAFAFVSCDDPQASQYVNEEKDAEILALKEKLKALNEELEEEEGDREMLIAKYDVAIDSLKNSVAELDSKLHEVKKVEPIVVTKAEPVPKKSEEKPPSSQVDVTAARRAAVGEKHDKFELNNGRVYHDVTITGVDEIGVRFSHRDGMARIDFMNLPSVWKERFHFDLDRFAKASKAERLARYHWEKSVDEKMAKINAEKKKIADQERIADLERALAEARRPVQITQVTKSQPVRRSSLDRYSSSVIYPSRYSSRSLGSTYCPPVTSRPSRSVYCPPIRRSPVISVPTIRSSPRVCPTPARRVPVTRVPTVRSSYKLH